jgi:hypothetical protein
MSAEEERSVRQVAPGIQVHSASDAMSSVKKLRITIGPLGADFSQEELEQVLASERAEPKAGLASLQSQVSSLQSAGVEAEFLTELAFLRTARAHFERIDTLLRLVPEEVASTVRDALEHAFKLGTISSEIDMRARHLKPVTSQKLLVENRSGALRARKGEVKIGTLEIVEAMDKLLSGTGRFKGQVRSAANFLATQIRKNLSTSRGDFAGLAARHSAGDFDEREARQFEELKAITAEQVRSRYRAHKAKNG